jgi:aldose sugar dehydrogenase
LPAEPGPYHQGGKLKIGPDNNLYAVIGDLNTVMGQLQNHKNGTEPNNSSAILRVNPAMAVLPKIIHLYRSMD